LPYPDPGNWPLSFVLSGAAIVLGLSIIALWFGPQYPYVPTGWFWFLALLLPVIGIIGWGAHTMADRFTYLPLLGVFVAVTWAVWNITETRQFSRKWGFLVAVCALVTSAVLTRKQLTYWKNSEVLFRHALDVTKDNIVAWDHLGIRLWFERRDMEAGKCFEEALRLNPNGPQVLYDYGNLLASQGQWAEASTNFEAAVRLMPENGEAQEHLGLALASLGRIEEGIEHVRLAIQNNPDAAGPHRSLAKMLASKGDLEGATAEYRKSLSLEPDSPETWYAMGIELALHGKWEEAILAYRETLRRDPGNAEAEYNLGYALKVQGNDHEAVAHLQTALALNPALPLAHYNLGLLLARHGERDSAISHLRAALRLKPDYREAQDKLRELGGNANDQKDDK
jgi:tetratricopeptide (TPR) repeat protein